MRQYLLMTARADNGSSAEARALTIRDVLPHARRFSSAAFPSLQDEHVVEWISPNGQVAAVSISNEPEGFDHDIRYAARQGEFFGIEGYLIPGGEEGLLRKSHDLLDTSQDIGGCFTLYRASDHGITAVTDSAGTGNACYAESDKLRILSNRSLWAHLVAQHDRTGELNPVLQLDDLALRNIANSGTVQGNRTLFRGVEMMPRRSQFTASPWSGRKRTTGITDPASEDRWQPTKEELDRICGSLISAFAPLQNSDLNLSLTGGRDSRMLLSAARHVEGLNLRTSTAGEPQDADVVLAQKLSSVMGVPHRLVSPPRSAPDVLMTEAIDSRITRVLDGHDWNLSAWDDMPDYGPFSVRPTMSGVGGEGLRGGMVMPGMVNMDKNRIAASLRNMQAGARDLFREPLNQAAMDDAHPWTEFAQHNPYAASDKYYKDERGNRWATSRRAAARLRSNIVDPLFDNKFMSVVETIPTEYKWDERLAYDIIQRLSPEISEVPIEGHHWKFDAQAGRSGSGDSHGARAVVTSSSRDGVKAWRMLDAPSLRASMRDFIESHLDGPVANVLDPAGVRAMLSRIEEVRPAVAWNLATVAAVASIKTAGVDRKPLKNTIAVSDARGLKP